MRNILFMRPHLLNNNGRLSHVMTYIMLQVKVYITTYCNAANCQLPELYVATSVVTVLKDRCWPNLVISVFADEQQLQWGAI